MLMLLYVVTTGIIVLYHCHDCDPLSHAAVILNWIVDSSNQQG